MINFPRDVLAGEVVAALLSRTGFGDAHNGLFLAAPRRTGKSTFLQCDLAPALDRAGVAVAYVDLWADPRRDPGSLIADAVGRKLGRHDGATLPDALRALCDATGGPVALVIDEAQHALTSEAGEAAMASLKSARDQLNRPDAVRLLLVMSGSDRDKLLRLVNSGAAPFYGSQVTRLPALGGDFIDFVARKIANQRPDLVPINQAALARAFELFGHRPQFFLTAIGEALSPLSGTSVRFEGGVLDAARQRQVDDEAQMEADYLAFRPLEQAVLWRMLAEGARFRPYDADALRFYREATGSSASAARVQAALESLRERAAPVVWKSARGEYAVADVAMHRWYEERVDAGHWPPRPE